MSKIKREHTIMSEFEKILIQIEKISEIKRIIPWRISRQQKGTAQMFMSFSYFTDTGLKYKMKKGGTAQELFVICKIDDNQLVCDKIKDIIDKLIMDMW